MFPAFVLGILVIGLPVVALLLAPNREDLRREAAVAQWVDLSNPAAPAPPAVPDAAPPAVPDAAPPAVPDTVSRDESGTTVRHGHSGGAATTSRGRPEASRPTVEILFIRKCGSIVNFMTNMRIKDAAMLMGVSDDTVRRWVDQGSLSAGKDDAGRKVIEGSELAAFARAQAAAAPDLLGVGSSARNRLVGLVTRVVSDTVMSQVEMQCGPHRIVSLMSTEAVEELGLVPGSISVAVVKSTNVIVETPGERT